MIFFELQLKFYLTKNSQNRVSFKRKFGQNIIEI
jgi:hypothetical protein